MKQRIERSVLVLAALGVAAGCAASSAERAPAAKPESAPLVAVSTTTGAVEREQRPVPLRVHVAAPTPVRPGGAAVGRDYRVEVRLENRGDRPIPLSPLSIQVGAFQRVDPVAGCERVEPVRVESPQELDPHDSFTTTVPLSCALESPGTYRVVAVAIVGEQRGDAVAPDSLLVSGATTVVVEGRPEIHEHY